MTAVSDLQGRLALVTGPSRGIGEAIAKELAARGAEVMLASRDREALDRVAGEIAAGGGTGSVRVVDLSRREEVQRLADAAAQVDVLINNAAYSETFTPLTDIGDEHWKQTFEVAFWSPLVLIRVIGTAMARRGRGSIINISSVVTQLPPPLTAAYVCAKTALESLTKLTAMELARKGVRCNAIAPGIVATELTAMMKPISAWTYYQQSVPLGREGECTEIAHVAAWLASDESSYVTGQIIKADGGLTTGQYGLLGAVRESN